MCVTGRVAALSAGRGGHTHSSKSRICWIWPPASVISCSRRVPRCRAAPRLIHRLRDIAAQLRREPGDQHGVFLIGLVPGQVLSAPRPRRHHRLHAHERHQPVRSQLPQHPPPVPGRLARHRHPGPALRRGPCGGPVQSRAQVPGAAPERPACNDSRVVIGHHDHLLLVGQVDPDIVFVTGTSTRNRPSRALRFRSPRETPLPLPMNVLLPRGTPARSASGGRSSVTPPTRTTSSMPEAARVESGRVRHQTPDISPHVDGQEGPPPLPRLYDRAASAAGSPPMCWITLSGRGDR